MMEQSIFLFIIAQIVTAVGVYAAIRADMREYAVRIGMLEKHNEKHICK